MKYEPKLCPHCESIMFWNSYFQAYYCPRCGGVYKLKEAVDIYNEPMKIYQVTVHNIEEYFRERRNAEEYLEQCGGGKLVEIILKDTVKDYGVN